MKAPNDRVDEFIDLWWRAFGERIARREARARAQQLLEIYRMIVSDLPPENQEASTPSGLEDSSQGAARRPPG